MTDYVKSTNFASKDSLASGNPLKIVKGTEIDIEFSNIATAIATKADTTSPVFAGVPTAPTAAPGTNTTQLANTSFVTAADTVAVTSAVSQAATAAAAVYPTKSGTGATGTWGINISGSAATATTSTTATTVSNGVYTVGNQTIGGVKTFSSAPVLEGIETGRGGGSIYSNSRYGVGALNSNTSGSSNIGVGYYALYSNTDGYTNTAVGVEALKLNTTGYLNTAMGPSALYSNTSGYGNSALGLQALENNTTGFNNTGVGYTALANNTTFVNCAGLGFGAQVTGNSQVQLGNGSTTTYVYGVVQNRSDLRDKTDVRDTQLGLEFIKALRPVDYRWDMRDSYRASPSEAPKRPAEGSSNEEISAYNSAMTNWLEQNKLNNIQRDGSKKRNRYHHGLIAQEVKGVIDQLGIDFGGYQDHSINGGEDVMSIGYAEFFAPLIKAVQQLSEKLDKATAKITELESKAL